MFTRASKHRLRRQLRTSGRREVLVPPYSSHGPAQPGSCNHLTPPFAPAPPFRVGDCVWLEWEGWHYAPNDVPGAAGDMVLWTGQYDGLYDQHFQGSDFLPNVYKQGYEEGKAAREQGLSKPLDRAAQEAWADKIGRDMASPCEPGCGLCFEGVCLQHNRQANPPGARIPGRTRSQRRLARKQLQGAATPRIKKAPKPMACAPVPLKPGYYADLMKPEFAGCKAYSESCGRPSSMWTTYSHYCCPSECVACPDDYPPEGYYELGIWPKSRPGTNEVMPQQGDLANLCCPIPRGPRGDLVCPNTEFGPTFLGSDNRCYQAKLKDCFYSEFGEPAPLCPQGTWEYGQPEWSQDNVRLCCPPFKAGFQGG